jgi:hypothetical protein
MLSAHDNDQIPDTGSRPKGGNLWAPGIAALQAASSRLKVAFGISLALYLLVKLVDVAVKLPGGALWELSLVPTALCCLALALRDRRIAEAEAADWELPAWAYRLALTLLLIFTAFLVELNTVPTSSAPDESAALAAGRQLIHGGSLRSESPLNARYGTNIIGNADAMYKNSDEVYYKVLPGTALLFAPFALLSDAAAFRLATGVFAVATIGILCWLATGLLRSRLGGLFAGVLLVTSPVFAHWSVTLFNNVPVLALELAALTLVLSASRERASLLIAAGALMGFAVFVRVTELAFVVPMAALVVWKYRSFRSALAFSLPALGGIAAVLIANAILYGDATFTPYAGANYLPLTSVQLPAVIFQQRYTDFIAGIPNYSSFSLGYTVRHLAFHLRYLASSTFAFPFLSLALAGLAWRLLVGRRNSWLLMASLFVAVGVVLLLYGRLEGNYAFYGRAVVRNSFVRYSLPVYGLLAVGGGAFMVEAARGIRNQSAKVLLVMGLAATVMTVGIGQSYDKATYGLNQLNDNREQDRAAWSGITAYLATRPTTPLLIGGAASAKLVDGEYHPYFINYQFLPGYFASPLIFSVAEQAAQERDVYVITSDGNQADKQLQTMIYTSYRPEQVLHTGAFRVHLLHLDPANYTLVYVDVWNTYAALDRWVVTPEGYLKTKVDTSYAELLGPVDADGDGRVDQDVTIELELLDSGPAVATISALDSRVSWGPVVLWTSRLQQTGTWRTVTVSLKKGEYLQGRLIVSPGVTLRSIGVVALGAK